MDLLGVTTTPKGRKLPQEHLSLSLRGEWGGVDGVERWMGGVVGCMGVRGGGWRWGGSPITQH